MRTPADEGMTAARRETMRRDDEVALEALVDRYDLDRVLDMLADICHGKADHLLTNWQDPRAARAWTKAGEKLSALSCKV